MTADDRGRLVDWQRQLIEAYERTGRAAVVRRKRTGSVAVRLDGSRELSMHDALARIDRTLAAR